MNTMRKSGTNVFDFFNNSILKNEANHREYDAKSAVFLPVSATGMSVLVEVFKFIFPCGMDIILPYFEAI